MRLFGVALCLLAISLTVALAADGCQAKVGATCFGPGGLQEFVSCLHKFCAKGSRTLISSGGGLDGLNNAAEYRSECQRVSSQIPSCPVDCGFTNCEWGHHTGVGVACWIAFAIAILVALYALVTGRPEEWRCTWPAGLWLQPHRIFVGALCMAPCILILALVYSLQMPDSTFDIMFWIFICPCIIGSALCRGLTPQQHAAALERQNQQNTAAVPAEGEEYAQLASIEDTNDIEAQSENVQLMLGRVDPGTAAETVADPPPYDDCPGAQKISRGAYH